MATQNTYVHPNNQYFLQSTTGNMDLQLLPKMYTYTLPYRQILGTRTYNKQLVHLFRPLLQCLGCLQEVLLFLCHLGLLHLQLSPLAVESVLLTLKFLANYVLFALLLRYCLHQGFKFCLSLPLKINTCIG